MMKNIVPIIAVARSRLGSPKRRPSVPLRLSAQPLTLPLPLRCFPSSSFSSSSLEGTDPSSWASSSGPFPSWSTSGRSMRDWGWWWAPSRGLGCVPLLAMRAACSSPQEDNDCCSSSPVASSPPAETANPPPWPMRMASSSTNTTVSKSQGTRCTVPLTRATRLRASQASRCFPEAIRYLGDSGTNGRQMARATEGIAETRRRSRQLSSPLDRVPNVAHAMKASRTAPTEKNVKKVTSSRPLSLGGRNSA
mmetsp:Transcript_4683/g.11020  ORF Transcript_4683/g.11020 Transcript_4683/m.11020 type:complete len:250 (+) Transcript_4683:685-1434(+)